MDFILPDPHLAVALTQLADAEKREGIPVLEPTGPTWVVSVKKRMEH